MTIQQEKKEITWDISQKEYWETEVYFDDWGWVTDLDDWEDYFDGIENSQYEIKLINHDDKGFVFLRKYNNKIYIHFAFVSIFFRKQGILKTMINGIKNRYKTHTIALESADLNTDKVWEKLNFIREGKKKQKLNRYAFNKQKMD